MTAKGVPSRGARAAFAGLFACLSLSLPSCASSYAGIPLKPGAAEPELQQLARRAQFGDKRAQLELGKRYEEGRGLAVNLSRAGRLFAKAAAPGAGNSFIYVPGFGRGGGGAVVPTYQAKRLSGLPEARERLEALEGRRDSNVVIAGRAWPEAADGTGSTLQKAPRDPSPPIRRTVNALLEPRPASESICNAARPALEALHGAAISECAAYAFLVRPSGGQPFLAFDFVLSIPIGEARQLEFPTTMVDPIEAQLIEDRPRRGRLTYYRLKYSDRSKFVILQFNPK